MTLEEFRALTDTWGGDVERWPPGSLEAARRIAQTPQGSEILEQARALDALLGVRPHVSRERVERAAYGVVVSIAGDTGRQHGAGRLWSWTRSSWLLPATSLACSALIGISLAMLLPATGDQEAIVLSMIIDSGSMAAGWTFQ